MLIPGGPGFVEGVMLSIIDSETWSGKPEPGIIFMLFVRVQIHAVMLKI